MKFYNREIEKAELERIKELAFTDHSRMTVLTGRRRIGKTSLVKAALANAEQPMVYLFTARKSEAGLVADFCDEIRSKLNVYVPDGMTTVKGVFRFLLELAKSRPFSVVIDEFQEFQNINPSVFSEFQNLWDSYRLETRMNLVLSGSVLNMMTRIFTNLHEPLFGRADNMLNLKPFKISVIKEILSDNNPEYTDEDLLVMYAITGGVPKYIELFCDNRLVTSDAMLRYTASPLSPFIDEGRNLLITEFGKDYGTYFSVLQAIAGGAGSQAEISARLGGIAIGGHLERLENEYDLIEKFRPIFAKPGSKNTVRYCLRDPFLQFWFRFIERNRSMIELDNYDDLQTLVLAQYPTYSGYLLERYFRQKLAEEGGFREIGSWWEPKSGYEASEIDIVALRTEGRRALVAEVKRRPRNYDHKLFMANVDRLESTGLKGYEVERRLLTMEDM